MSDAEDKLLLKEHSGGDGEAVDGVEGGVEKLSSPSCEQMEAVVDGAGEDSGGGRPQALEGMWAK
jgi:hypothetical protein